MSKTKKIVLGVVSTLVIVVVLFVSIVAMQPSQFTVSRSASMNAPPATVFAEVNDFHNWQHWSPWAKRDPNAKNSFEGHESGQGAAFHWEGNAEVGEGQMTILESQPGEKIRIKLEFIKPFPSTANALYAFKPEGEGTKVTWTMSGENNFIGKLFCMFIDMDEMVGGDFDKGLAMMKEQVEQKPGEAKPAEETPTKQAPAEKPSQP